MKNYLSEGHFDQTKLFIRKMRTTCLILMVFASSVFAIEGNTQTAKVSIAMKNAYIIEVIRAIESQTDYLFVYNKNEIDLTRRVDLEVKNKSVAEVLNGVFINTKVVYAMEG
ncbi:MAG: STN domain-containing protein, partial [Ignavibacteria bacterium]|nr:STN domain-containing protein [Ignavibacteria bacterium]